MKRGLGIIFCLSTILILSLSFASAGMFNWFNKGAITGNPVEALPILSENGEICEEDTDCISGNCDYDIFGDNSFQGNLPNVNKIKYCHSTSSKCLFYSGSMEENAVGCSRCTSWLNVGLWNETTKGPYDHASCVEDPNCDSPWDDFISKCDINSKWVNYLDCKGTTPYCGLNKTGDSCSAICVECGKDSQCNDSTKPFCVNNKCSASTCVPNCFKKECGSDGCGGFCGEACGSNYKCGELGRCIPFTSTDCNFENPKDFAGNYILMAKDKAITRDLWWYAGTYCQIVKGCAGFDPSSVVLKNDSVKACKCDTTSGCSGRECITNVAADGAWERVASVTCTECPKGACEKEECIDSDGGLNYYVYGTSKDSEKTLLEGCVDSTNKVREFYCGEDDRIYSEDYECPNGCANGACVSGPSECNDSDNGLNYYTKGRVFQASTTWNFYTDYCSGPGQNNRTFGTLIEFSCDELNNTKNTSYFCEGGCREGSCVNSSNLCIDSDKGVNYLEKGNTNVSSSGTGIGWEYFEDECAEVIDSAIYSIPSCEGEYPSCFLIETSCQPSVFLDQPGTWDNVIHQTKFEAVNAYLSHLNCPNGCKDGACLPEISKQSYCEGMNCVLYEGEEIVIGGNTIEIEMIDSTGAVRFKVDGEVTDKLSQGESYKLFSGEIFLIRDVDYNANVEEISRVYFSIKEEANTEEIVCESKCLLNDNCYRLGTRKDEKYCAPDIWRFINQLEDGQFCHINFECKSNFCNQGICNGATFIERAINWVGNLFSQEENEIKTCEDLSNCLVKKGEFLRVIIKENNYLVSISSLSDSSAILNVNDEQILLNEGKAYGLGEEIIIIKKVDYSLKTVEFALISIPVFTIQEQSSTISLSEEIIFDWSSKSASMDIHTYLRDHCVGKKVSYYGDHPLAPSNREIIEGCSAWADAIIDLLKNYSVYLF